MPYSPEEYAAMDIGDYRKKFPAVTADLTDEQLFDIVMSTDDDMEDDEWAILFAKKGQP